MPEFKSIEINEQEIEVRFDQAERPRWSREGDELVLIHTVYCVFKLLNEVQSDADIHWNRQRTSWVLKHVKLIGTVNEVERTLYVFKGDELVDLPMWVTQVILRARSQF